MRRASLGIIAAVLLLVGGVSALNGPGGSSAWGFSGVCIKSGLVLGALWLGLPQISATLAPGAGAGGAGVGAAADSSDTGSAAEPGHWLDFQQEEKRERIGPRFARGSTAA